MYIYIFFSIFLIKSFYNQMKKNEENKKEIDKKNKEK